MYHFHGFVMEDHDIPTFGVISGSPPQNTSVFILEILGHMTV